MQPNAKVIDANSPSDRYLSSSLGQVLLRRERMIERERESRDHLSPPSGDDDAFRPAYGRERPRAATYPAFAFAVTEPDLNRPSWHTYASPRLVLCKLYFPDRETDSTTPMFHRLWLSFGYTLSAPTSATMPLLGFVSRRNRD